MIVAHALGDEGNGILGSWSGTFGLCFHQKRKLQWWSKNCAVVKKWSARRSKGMNNAFNYHFFIIFW